MNVFTYWEGPRPEYIDICLRSVERVCRADGVEFHLVTPETVGEYIGDSLTPRFRDIPEVPCKACAIRSALVARHGGFWFDADSVGIRSPRTLVDRYPDADVLYTTWNKPPLRILNGNIYMKQGCWEANQWVERINYRLEHEFDDCVIWTGIGEKVLTPLLVESKTAWRVDRSVFLPVDIDQEVPVFFEAGDPRDWIRDDTVCFGLNHSWFMYHKRNVMEIPQENWHASPLLVHRVLHSALMELEA